MRLWIKILFAVFALTFAVGAQGQYYDWGTDPASLRWQQIRTDRFRVIYPEEYDTMARRTLHYLNAAGQDIGYGFRRGAMRIPVVMHTRNTASNGIVIWAPKRIEMLTPPSIESYSMLWTKQLAAHEQRHAVQYNNLNRNTFRALYYLLGEQGAFVSLLGLPLWVLEGDATMIETDMSTFGRGRQPSFSIGYRAKSGQIADGRNPDRWFCGSYRDYIPDQYELGYQMATYAYNKYGRVIWDDVADYASRYPFLFFTTDLALKKRVGTRTRTLFTETFDSLQAFWNALPEVTPSTEIISTPTTAYTTYSHPQAIDSVRVVALKTDFDRTARLVEIDLRSGSERLISHVGAVSTRPALGRDGRLWWTEYRRSVLWGERYDSRLCWIDLEKGRTHSITTAANVLYPTPIEGDSLAWVEYTPEGRYTIATGRAGKGNALKSKPLGEEIHGLAWDDTTRKLYYIGLGDEGMYLGSIDEQGGDKPLTQPAYVSLSDLRAEGGRLYFGSIRSGRDEAHTFDLASGCEWQLTESKFGSFDPSPAGDRLLVTTYDERGYLLATQPLDSIICEVEWAHVPTEVVNPPRRRLPVVNLDTVRIDEATLQAHAEQLPARRYRKGLNYFKFHSWAPVSIDLFEAIDNFTFDPQLGATLISQNLLSSVTAFATYGWHHEQGSMVRGAIDYHALGPHIELRGQYGGAKQPVYKPKEAADPAQELKTYYNISARVSLPMQLSSGHHLRYLTPLIEWQYYNGLLYNDQTKDYRLGVNRLTSSITFGDNVRSAYRDLLPRWGYAVRLTHSFNPTDRDFAQTFSIFGQAITPAIARHHSLRLRAVFQTAEQGKSYSFSQRELYPRGAKYELASSPSRYVASAIDYRLPLCYPDGGIPAVLYFKRIALNVGFHYAAMRTFDAKAQQYNWQSVNSFGAELMFDINLLRMPSAATSTLTLSLFKPSNRKGVHFSASIGLPI
ncbi:MAG: hypothetical protein IJX68_08555 [Rikenellaceae bacterium]|nr:hypothetical protein [Rikenellaceae bacterium]